MPNENQSLIFFPLTKEINSSLHFDIFISLSPNPFYNQSFSDIWRCYQILFFRTETSDKSALSAHKVNPLPNATVGMGSASLSDYRMAEWLDRRCGSDLTRRLKDRSFSGTSFRVWREEDPHLDWKESSPTDWGQLARNPWKGVLLQVQTNNDKSGRTY